MHSPRLPEKWLKLLDSFEKDERADTIEAVEGKMRWLALPSAVLARKGKCFAEEGEGPG